MHIKKVEIIGFKSYAHKQVVDKFDEQFNAITGLNGSGKSNFLEAIYFVFGITDLNYFRAENTNSLVYKSGQAGITKASVTITFDNKDKTIVSIEYANFEEITIRRQVVFGGRVYYSINGKQTSDIKASEFFRAVGLKLNNPDFLINQERISQVLEMKTDQILNMVEGTTDTETYKRLRQRKVTTIANKDSAIAAINKELYYYTGMNGVVAEAKVIHFTQRKEKIEAERNMIRETMKTLGRERRNTILKAIEKVEKDFNKIIATLLPGTTGKLSPPVGKTVFDGLQVKVAFNGKWKDSLRELSEGQRSIVALSFLLSTIKLKFKSTPFYFIDEIDSALDSISSKLLLSLIRESEIRSQLFFATNMVDEYIPHSFVCDTSSDDSSIISERLPVNLQDLLNLVHSLVAEQLTPLVPVFLACINSCRFSRGLVVILIALWNNREFVPVVVNLVSQLRPPHMCLFILVLIALWLYLSV